MPSDSEWNRYWLFAIVALGTVSILYSVLVVQRVLLGVGAFVPLLLLYLLWRLVRAHERIAVALEADR